MYRNPRVEGSTCRILLPAARSFDCGFEASRPALLALDTLVELFGGGVINPGQARQFTVKFCCFKRKYKYARCRRPLNGGGRTPSWDISLSLLDWAAEPLGIVINDWTVCAVSTNNDDRS